MKLFVVLVLLTVLSGVLCHSLEKVIPKFFKKVGKFQYSDKNGYSQIKTYYISRDMKMLWMNAFMFCRTFNMDLVELPTQREANHFLNLFGGSSSTSEIWYHIGGSYMGADKDDFYWMTTAKQIDYPLIFAPGQPNNYGGKERCLSIQHHAGSYRFNDVDCFQTWIWNFVCEKIESEDKSDERFQ